MENFQDKILEIFEKKYKKDKADLSKNIKKCAMITAIKLDMEVNDIYQIIYSESYLRKCLYDLNVSRDCSDLDLDECSKSCKCFVLDGVCHSRTFPDYEKINEDPDKYVQGVSTEKLKEMVKLASYLYFNFDGGGLTDNSFESLEYYLKKRLKLKERLYEKIGAPPVDRIRTKLPYPMMSLNKVKPNTAELFKFLNTSNKVQWSLKLDGVSALAVYNNGILQNIYTRGDGTIGGDVSYLKDHIKIPKKLENDISFFQKESKTVIIRGELILTKMDWVNFKDLYSNARSFVSAKVNSGYISFGLESINFVAYEIIKPSIEPEKTFKILELIGFTIPAWGLFTNPTTYDLVEEYKTQREAAIYDIDGLVLDNSLRESAKAMASSNLITDDQKGSNPVNKIAFKMALEGQIRKTKLLNVEWNISRYGVFYPVAIFEAVFINGIRIHRATAYNAGKVRDLSLGKGTELEIIRSGDVIPKIHNVKIDNNISPIYPSPEWAWIWKYNMIELVDIENNPVVHTQRLLHFFQTIQVPRLGEKTLDKIRLYFASKEPNKPWIFYLQKITTATPKEFRDIKGIGPKLSEGFYANISERLENVRVTKLINAITNVGMKGFGRKLIMQLLRYFPNVFLVSSDEIKEFFKKNKVPQFGLKRVETLLEGLPPFKQTLLSLNSEKVNKAFENDYARYLQLKNKGYNPLIKGKKFVLTGFMGHIDYELEDYIYDNQGDFIDTVTSDVSAVISANIGTPSEKVKNAISFKIPIYTLEEFVLKFNIPYLKIYVENILLPKLMEINSDLEEDEKEGEYLIDDYDGNISKLVKTLEEPPYDFNVSLVGTNIQNVIKITWEKDKLENLVLIKNENENPE